MPLNDVGLNARDFIFEALRMKCLSHPNVMTLIGICCSPNPEHEQYYKPMIALPYMVLRDLRTYLRKQRSLYNLRFSVENDGGNVTIPPDVTFVCLFYIHFPYYLSYRF